jgi:hypothetical protein
MSFRFENVLHAKGRPASHAGWEEKISSGSRMGKAHPCNKRKDGPPWIRGRSHKTPTSCGKGAPPAVEDTIVQTMANETELLQGDTFSRVRVSLAEFETLDRDERMRHLVSQLERDRGASRKLGVDAFEVPLAYVALAGPVEEPLKKLIWELHHVRNTIVHRNSVADRRLVYACPWLNLKIGDKVTVNHDAITRYGDVVLKYAMTIARRLIIKYGVNERVSIKSISEFIDGPIPS